MTTSQDDRARTVKRTCKVIQRNGQPCGREYRVQPYSRPKGCPECCPELELYPERSEQNAGAQS